MPRLFVATYLNPDGVQRLEELGRANDHLSQKWNMRARWVTADKLHLTWLFLGEVEEESVDDVAECLGEAVENFDVPASNRGSASNNGSVSVAYDHFELWPSARKARLGVIVPSTVAPQIVELAGFISKKLSKFLTAQQQEANKRPFKPHLTVMRLAPQSRTRSKRSAVDSEHNVDSDHGKPRASIEDVKVASSIFPIMQSIDRVELIESDMGKKAQGYLTRASFNVRTSFNK